MKLSGFVLSLILALSARADVTIVQKVERAGSSTEVTLKIKGDKMRMEVGPKLTTIIDAKTGEMINLMHEHKTVMRMSGEKVRAAMEMARQFNAKAGKAETKAKSQFVPTGKKEMVNGYETELYTWETPEYKATYWIAPKYPNGAAILKELQTLNPDIWKGANTQMPDYRALPGLPIKTVFSIGQSEVTTTLAVVKQDPINDAEFAVPQDYQETKLPEMSEMLQKNSTPSPSVSP